MVPWQTLQQKLGYANFAHGINIVQLYDFIRETSLKIKNTKAADKQLVYNK